MFHSFYFVAKSKANDKNLLSLNGAILSNLGKLGKFVHRNLRNTFLAICDTPPSKFTRVKAKFHVELVQKLSHFKNNILLQVLAKLAKFDHTPTRKFIRFK
jgi:hypothetical protein